MDVDLLGRELLRSLRGHRSQRGLSRRLGYRSNVVATWENGHRWPTAAEFTRLAVATGVDARHAWTRFHRRPPGWLDRVDPTTAAGVAHLLADLRGAVPVAEVARRVGASRFAVRRWLAGEAEPRLPDFLRLVDALSLRLLDWCAGFVDPAGLASAREAWARLEAHRRAAAELPWTQAVARALELRDYPPHRTGWIAARLGIPVEEEARCLAALAESGQIRWAGDRWEGTAPAAVDTRRDPETSRRLKRFWAELAVARLDVDPAGLHSYNVFSVSQADLERLRELHRSTFRALRSIVDASPVGERVAVASLHLFALDPEP